MLEIALASFLLSVIHALIPSHWLPLLSISKVEKWNYKETLTTTLFAGFAHSFGTIVVGVLLGVLGMKIAAHFNAFTQFIAPILLITVGSVYLISRPHKHPHLKINERSRFSLIVALALAMFLSPCLEMEIFFLKAAEHSWIGILLVSAIFVCATSGIMVLLVALGYNGMERLNFSFVEKNHRKISGLILLVLGISTILVGH